MAVPPSPEVLRQWEDDVADATVDAARSAFVRAHPTEPWVWKDPRTCLTLSFWRHALVRPVAGIVVHRNPLDIARSLEQRNHMDPEYSSALWMRYMRLLLEQAGGMPLLVTGYDGLLEDPVGWSDAVRNFLGDLGMPVAAQLDHAFDRRIRRPDAPPQYGARTGCRPHRRPLRRPPVARRRTPLVRRPRTGCRSALDRGAARRGRTGVAPDVEEPRR